MCGTLMACLLGVCVWLIRTIHPRLMVPVLKGLDADRKGGWSYEIVVPFRPLFEAFK